MSHKDILVLIDTWLYENHILERHNNIILKFFTKYIVHLVFCSNLLQTETLHPENKLIKIEEVMKFTRVMKKNKTRNFSKFLRHTNHKTPLYFLKLHKQ